MTPSTNLWPLVWVASLSFAAAASVGPYPVLVVVLPVVAYLLRK